MYSLLGRIWLFLNSNINRSELYVSVPGWFENSDDRENIQYQTFEKQKIWL